jgi:ribosomal protein S18 acetylase RimI-like enzyme
MVAMDREELVIRPIENAGLGALLAYLEDQVRDNGRNGTPLFLAESRAAPWVAAEREAPFRVGLHTPIGQPRWRRVWSAVDARDAIVGHVDLRAHADAGTSHRALLGMGVHRAHRRQGLGRRLVEFVTAWAQQDTTLAWIDLDFLAGNLPAERLYRAVGFEEVGTIRDMFRIDGQSVDNVSMTKRIRA